MLLIICDWLLASFMLQMIESALVVSERQRQQFAAGSDNDFALITVGHNDLDLVLLPMRGFGEVLAALAAGGGYLGRLFIDYSTEHGEGGHIGFSRRIGRGESNLLGAQ